MKNMEQKYGYHCVKPLEEGKNIIECNEVETRTVYVSVGCDITWEIVEVPLEVERCINCGGRCNTEYSFL